jgi:glutathione S-transferase
MPALYAASPALWSAGLSCGGEHVSAGVLASPEQTRRLVVLKVSPWSERAKWVLDHHRLAYRLIEHVPFLGERRLRRLVGPERPRATVPVLVDGDRVLADSWDIALYADREGAGAKLIPADRAQEILRFNDLAEVAMSTGRGLVVRAMLASPEALDEGLPPNIPRLLHPLMRPMASYGTRWFAKKYGLLDDDVAARREKLRSALLELRATLAKSSPYLLGAFSYADIVTAICLQGIVPVADRYLPLGPATRKAWTMPDFAEEFADLIAWRDRLYEQHRPPAIARSG